MRKFDDLFFGTSNINKYREIKTIFEIITSIQVKHASISPLEIQANNLGEIATFSLKSCVEKVKRTPLFVEDSGLFIKSCNGFPGPYSAYIFETIGNKGILRLLDKEKDRSAYFQSTIALSFEEETHIFTAVVDGQISNEISHVGWGYDPIFIPDGCDKTFAQMSIDEKNLYSHRGKSLEKLLNFFKNK